MIQKTILTRSIGRQKSQGIANESLGLSKRSLFQDIASTAESGWDFSSRWLRDKRNLKTVETTQVLPVDLNALMCWNMNILEYLYELIGERID